MRRVTESLVVVCAKEGGRDKIAMLIVQVTATEHMVFVTCRITRPACANLHILVEVAQTVLVLLARTMQLALKITHAPVRKALSAPFAKRRFV